MSDDCFLKVFCLLLKIKRDECIMDISTLCMYSSTLIRSLATLFIHLSVCCLYICNGFFIHLSVCCLYICNGFWSARVLACTGIARHQLTNDEIA